MKLSIPLSFVARACLHLAQGALAIVKALLDTMFGLAQIASRPVLVLGALSLLFCLFPYWRVVVDFESVRPADVAPMVAERTRWFLAEALPGVLGAAGTWMLLRMVCGPLAYWAASRHEEIDLDSYERWQRIQLQQGQLDQQRAAADAKQSLERHREP